VQCFRTEVHSEIFPETRFACDNITRIYGQSVAICTTSYILLNLGDTELPKDFLERGLQSGADIYGCPMFQRNRPYAGHDNCVNYGFKTPFVKFIEYEFDDKDAKAYPENAVLIKTEVAQKYHWQPNQERPHDHILNFYLWADAQGYVIVNDKAILSIHHHEKE
jgi:hypothetical protein